MKRLFALLIAALLAAPSLASELDQQIALVRQAHNTDREAMITLNVHFTAAESAAFWPLYREYRKAMQANGDMRLALIKDMAASYESMTDEQADTLLKRHLNIRQDGLDTRRVYAMRFGEVLPGKKVARVMQIEHKMDAAIDMQLAAEIPLIK